MHGEWPPAATLHASGSACGPIWGAFPSIATHAGPQSAIDGCTRRQPYSPKAHWISYPCRLGYNVSALTGDPTKEAYVKELGASAVVNGPEWAESARPLESQKWAGAIDTVGSKVLARVLAEMDYNGVVAAVD